MTEPAPLTSNAAPATGRALTWTLAIIALALAGGSAWRSVLALPAIAVVVIVTARSSGGVRWLVGGLGMVACAFGLYRFTLEWAVPNIVSSGQFAAEERAVSRLREILWAEDRVRESGWADTDMNGRGEYAFLGELAGLGTPRRGVKLDSPLLRGEQFHLATDGMTVLYHTEGYAFAIYLPGPSGAGVGEGRGAVDTNAATHRFLAYAWPMEWGKGGVRAFYIDQDDRICETNNAQGYSGLDRIPHPNAALAGNGMDSPACTEHTLDGGNWKAWKGKKPRAARP